MSAQSQFVLMFLWCAQPVLQSVVAVIFWRRKLHKQFPVFFAYLLFQILIFAVTYPPRRMGNYEWFFWGYWLGAAGSAVLGFKVIHEVFLDIFRPYHTLQDLGTVLFKWAGVVMLMVSAVVAFSNSGDQGLLIQAVTTLDTSVRLVQSGLILFLLLFSRFLGVSRKQQSFGIALGFGLFASVEIVLLALSSGAHLDPKLVSFVNTATYNLVILIWLLYSLQPGTAREAANHLQTQRWEESLADLHPADAAASNSLIPMFEGMVERAISRSSVVIEPSDSNRLSEPSSSRKAVPAAAAVAASKGRS